MTHTSILWQLALADFRERTRRYSYLLTLMVGLYLGYLVLTGQYSYHFGPFHPVYTSSWVGATVALAGALIFSFVGFYIVRTSISRDRETRVGEILAATRLSNGVYLLAKFVSNLLVLWSMVAALAVAGYCGMVITIPWHQIHMLPFLIPFVGFPMITTIFVAGAAVLFDTVRFLRGAVGNVLFFVVAQFLLASGLIGIPALDLGGIAAFETSVKETIAALYPGRDIPMSVGFIYGMKETAYAATSMFEWGGFDWNSTLITYRLLWPAVALVMLILSLAAFDRFTHSPRPARGKIRRSHRSHPVSDHVPASAFHPSFSFSAIPAVRPSFALLPLIRSELLLGLKELPWIWLLIGLALLVAESVVPYQIARHYLLPAAMIWPLVFWSNLGTRESRYNTGSLLFSSAGVHTRQVVAQLAGGIVIALIMTTPMLVRAAAAADVSYVLLLLVSAAMIPSVAYALGNVSGSRKLFEVIYPMIWYGGSIDKITAIDLLGTTADSTGPGRITAFLALAAAAITTAALVRRRRAQM